MYKSTPKPRSGPGRTPAGSRVVYIHGRLPGKTKPDVLHIGASKVTADVLYMEQAVPHIGALESAAASIIAHPEVSADILCMEQTVGQFIVVYMGCTVFKRSQEWSQGTPPVDTYAQTENVVYMGVPYSNGLWSGPKALHPLSHMLRQSSCVYGCTVFKRSLEWSQGTPPVVTYAQTQGCGLFCDFTHATVCIWVCRIETVPGVVPGHSSRCHICSDRAVVYMGVPYSNGPWSGPKALHPWSHMLRQTTLCVWVYRIQTVPGVVPRHSTRCDVCSDKKRD